MLFGCIVDLGFAHATGAFSCCVVVAVLYFLVGPGVFG